MKPLIELTLFIGPDGNKTQVKTAGRDERAICLWAESVIRENLQYGNVAWICMSPNYPAKVRIKEYCISVLKEAAADVLIAAHIKAAEGPRRVI